MKKLGNTVISIIVAISILLMYAEMATAIIEIDCPSNKNRPTTDMAYAYSNWDPSTNNMTYFIDVINSPGTALKEYCVYPDPGFTGSDSGLWPLYPLWSVDRPGGKPYFGFEDKGSAPTMPFNGDTGVTMGKAKYTSGAPTSELILLHIINSTLCSIEGDPSCWRIPAGSPLPTPTPTPGPAPVADAGGPYTGLEGSSIAFDGSNSTGSSLQYRWDFNNDGIWDTTYSTNPISTYTWYDDYGTTVTRTVTLEVYDGTTTNTDTATITVYNVAPTVSLIADTTGAPTVNFTGSFTDPGTLDTHTYLWEFGDSATTTGTLIPSHAYSSPGIYIVNLTITDDDGGVGYQTINVDVQFTTPIPDDLPTRPLCPVAIALGPSSINVSWWASTDDHGVTGYRVYRSTDNITFNPITVTTDLYYIDTTVSRGTTYYYSIRAIDTIGQESIPSDVVHATPRDINPPVVTITPIDPIPAEATSPSGASVNFSVVAFDDIDGYLTATCVQKGPNDIYPLGWLTVTCSARDSDGNLGSAVYTVRVVDTTPPTDPTNLVAITISSSRIDLSWTASYDVVGVFRYWIYRSLDNINFDLITSTSGTSYSDSSLTANTTYYYYVKAIDTSYNPSGPSNIAYNTTLPYSGGTPTPTPTSTPPGGGGGGGGCGKSDCIPPVITITILTVPMPAEATSPSGAPINFDAIAIDNIDGPVTVSCSASPGSMFPVGYTELYCTAADSSGNIGELMRIVQVVDTTPPSDPTNLVATAHSSTRIDLTWTASTDIVGILEYWIYRSRDGITFEQIGYTSATMFVSNGLIPNTTYYYYVKAVDTSYNPSIGQSNTASATTFPQPPSGGGGDGGGGTPTPTPTPPGGGGEENPCSPPGNTPSGQPIETYPTAEVGMQFDVVTNCGDTTAVVYYDNMWTSLPGSFEPLLFYEIDTTATYQNYITIMVTYSQSDIPSGVSENSLRIFHYENGAWVDVTTALDTTSNIITGRVSSLSPFGIAGVGGSGGGGGGGGGGGIPGVSGPSFGPIGFIILAICLIAISIFRLRKK